MKTPLSPLVAFLLVAGCSDDRLVVPDGDADADADAGADADSDADTDADADADGDGDEEFECTLLGAGACDVIETSAGGFFPWQIDAAGFSAGHTCARLGSGELACWGVNRSGQLGDGTLDSRPEPARVREVDLALQVAAGGVHTCAVLEDRTVECWGANARGQLGNGTTTDSAHPVYVSAIEGAQSVVTGGRHTCATLLDGTIACWGDNGRGQLGDEAADDGSCGIETACSTEPSSPVPGLDDIVEVALGDHHSCARTATGTVSCWGANESGELGDGTLEDRATPGVVPSLSPAVHIAAGGSQTCALLSGGHVRCWGAVGFDRDFDLGQEDTCNDGIDDPAPCVTTPGPAIEGIVDATAITVGKEHGCALVTGGRVLCWGSNRAGQLGGGDLEEHIAPDGGGFVPVEALDVEEADGITAGRLHTCAWRADGIWCWGDDEFGQVGLEPAQASAACMSRVDTPYPCEPAPTFVAGLPR